jgi:hypothetical protein
VPAVTHKRTRRSSAIAVIAVVAALHIAVCWMFLEATRPPKISSLEVTYLTLVMPESVSRRPAQPPPPPPPPRRSPPTPPVSRPPPRSQPNAPAPGEVPAPGKEDNAIHAPINWANELNRTARESASGESAPRPREFGAPHIAPTPPAKPPEFGWSHSRTHRMERGPGSVGIHLGDHCVIALAPLPSVVCSPGKKEANGDLFKHMRDPPQLGDWKDPQ